MNAQRNRLLPCALLVCLVFLCSATASATITVTGSAADRQAWNDLVSQCSSRSNFFQNMITQIQNSAWNVDVVLVRSKKDVIIDSFATNEVDLDDILDYPPLDPPHTVDRCQQIVHILWERYTAACTPGTDFNTAHAAAVAEENAYRASLGYTDTLDGNVALSDDGEKICYLWHEAGQADVTTYVPISDQRSEGRVNVVAVTPTPHGTQYSLEIDTSYPNLDVLSVPSSFGGGLARIQGFSGTMVLETSSSPYPNYDSVRVVQLQTTAPPIPLPPPFYTTGINTLVADPYVQGFGYYNRQNGQVSVTYSGHIVNNIYPSGNPLPFFSSFYAIFHPGDTQAVFHTSAALLDGEPGQWWTHRPETIFVATLDTSQETVAPSTTSTPCGSARCVLNADNTLTYSVVATGLSSLSASAYVQVGDWASTGPVLFSLNAASYTRWAGVTSPLSTNQRNQLSNNQLYVNIVTSQNPLGEIRGQLVAPTVLQARLGNVNTGNGSVPADVLRVAGSTGHPVYRELTHAPGSVPISILATPAGGGSNLYAIWVFSGEPTLATLTQAILADGTGHVETLGTSCFCLPGNNTVTRGLCPCPTRFPTGFTSKAIPNPTVAAALCLHASPADPRAPTTINFNLPTGKYTITGVIFDPNASTAGPRKVSLTNSVTVKVQ